MGAAAVMVLGVVGWVWTLLDQPPREVVPADLSASADAARDKPELPMPVSSSEVVPLHPRDAAATDTGTSSADASGTAGGMVALQSAVFTGRVVETDGEPIEGAIVRHYPARRSRAQHGLEESVWLAEIPWSGLATATTDEEGRFRLPSDEVPTPDEGDSREQLSSPYAYDVWPQVVVLHPDYAVRPFLCEGFRMGSYDCGDIVLRPGAILRGRVTDGDGRPLAGARFQMSIFSGPWDMPGYGPLRTVRSAVGGSSGADGRFELRQLWQSRASFDVHLDGYMPAVLDTEGLAWGEVRDLPDVVLSPGFGLGGLVVDADGEPIAEAEVLARSAIHTPTHLGEDSALLELRIRVRGSHLLELRTRTDGRGAFAITGLDDEAYSVIVGADGFETTALRDIEPSGDRLVIALVRQASVLVTVQAKGTEERVADVSAKARRLTGGDYEDMATPLGVLFGREALDAAGVSGDPRGALLVQNAGTYRTELTVAAPGYATNGFLLTAVTPPEMATRTVQLVRESSVSGRVSDPNDAPLVGATVTLAPPKDLRVELPEREATTDAGGRYRLGDLRAGDWTLRVEAEGHVPSEQRTVIVKAEQAVEDEDVRLVPGARIEGLVLAADGAPAALASVVARRVDPQQEDPQTHTVKVDSEGRFELEALPPGDYRVTADPGAEREVAAAAGETVEVTLVLRRRPVVHGRVTDANGPVAGARVGLFNLAADLNSGGGYSYPATTDELGEYELRPPVAGEYVLAARYDDAFTAPVRRAFGWGTREIVDLQFGGGWASGRVLGVDDGEPAEGVRVSLHPMERRADGSLHTTKPLLRFRTHPTDTEGRYRFDRLPAGPFHVEVYRRGFMSPSMPPIDVPDGGGVELPDILLGSGGSITGRVVTADGSPLPPKLLVELWESESSRYTVESHVEEDGRFELRGLSGGSYRLVVDTQTKIFTQGKPPPVPLGEMPVSLADGEALTTDIIIEPPP